MKRPIKGQPSDAGKVSINRQAGSPRDNRVNPARIRLMGFPLPLLPPGLPRANTLPRASGRREERGWSGAFDSTFFPRFFSPSRGAETKRHVVSTRDALA